VPDESPIWKDVGRFAAQGALLGAAGEQLLRIVLERIRPGVYPFNPYAVWMAPLINFTVLIVLLGGIAVAARMVASRGAIARVLRLTAYTVAALGPLLLLSAKLGFAALFILAAGLGSLAARLVERRRWDPLVGRATMGLAGLAIAWAVLIPAVRAIRYRAAVSALPPPAANRPNVLLLILDTVSAREMSLYGYHRRTTPVLDSIARQGVVFDRAIAPAPWTLPSHAGMFTGYRADHLETRYLVPLQTGKRVVAEEFAQAGYVTGGFVANLEYTGRASGLNRGFHAFVDYSPSWRMIAVSSPVGRRVFAILNRGRARPAQPVRKYAEEVNREFLAWHEGVGRRPWFAFLNYYDAHDPYVPPLDDERRFLSPRQKPVYFIQGVSPNDTAAIGSARALHDAALYSLDRAIGSLLEELGRRGELERTVVVVSSDHGEEWGEQGVLLHGNSVYLPSLHVPLIVVYPPAVPAGKRLPQVVGTRHVGATMLDLAGLATTGLAGTSLAAAWRAESSLSENLVVSWVEQAIRQPANYPASRSALYSVVTDSSQVIVGADTAVFDVWSAGVQRIPQRLSIPRAGDVIEAARAIRKQ
jgi:arylsulfatase A-like enzyme